MTSTKALLAALFLVAYSLVAVSWAFDDPRELESLHVRMYFRGTAAITGTADTMSLAIYKVPQWGNCTVPIETDPEGKRFVSFSWKNPGSAPSYDYSCTATVMRSQSPRLLRDEPIPSGVFGNYTYPSELVPITPEMASKAQSLIAGADGEFLAASILSSWVHSNMKYDKDYFGKILDSRQIFDEMTGVCEEYSHLFLAMLRSVGIPARYVTGFVYGQSGWDPHAWVEVYFPMADVWIPFDPTYAENGYVDASHVRFFDSIDGSFAAFRTSFTYNALGKKPSIDWDEPAPRVTVEDELLGHELLKVNVSQEEQAVKVGNYALVKADVKNVAGTFLYPRLKLVYVAKNLGAGENLELAYGNESVYFALAPDGKKTAYWVLRAKSQYIISPKVVAEGAAFDAGNITGLDEAAGPDSELELFSDKDGYRKSDIVKLTVTNKGRADAALTELTTGISKTAPAGGRVEFKVPARSGEAAVYSSTGDFARLFLPVYDSGLDARLAAPEKALAGRPFEVTVSSLDPTLRISASVGNRSTTMSGTGLLRFNHTMAESGVIAARISSGNNGGTGTAEVLRKYVEVLPAPEVSFSPIVGSNPYLNVTLEMRNGNLSSARLLAGQSSYYARLSGGSGRLTFRDNSAKCGKKLGLHIEATGTDLLGQEDTGIYDAYEEVQCGFFDTLIQRILDFFLAPFAA